MRDSGGNDAVEVGGIMLRRIINSPHIGSPPELQVLAEVDGEWRIVIEELDDGPASHIVEPAGIRNGKATG